MDNEPIIALDFSNSKDTEAFLNRFDSDTLNVKIGMELFYQQGPEIVYLVKNRGHSVFLDIKLHDIPTTVKKAMSGIARLGVDMINVHAAGGSRMIAAAVEGLESGTAHGRKRPLLLAVTQLTSTSEQIMQVEQGISFTMEESVRHYAKLAFDSGADGVVCSAHEADLIRSATDDRFLRVTPGIRLDHSSKDDQVRVATPSEAREMGSTHIVVGRPITQAADPAEIYSTIQREWKG
ncbi:orotidine-5'-phosphate decarboxylase [Alkalibacterium pelagium]|uniref:Orotidine 5'-phosphate decarboxylase n=1 Tax=Alkalibacterium pelagium TaxID=426702 RepID=A0A1H7GLE9_9LACT|nr:orotidine-5'-phosphate decarboxylase [Alkalibacterium pelagium]GEN49778.1 orotidine 5'-phosphate decarboxylase [Alkalibacterium pelagium]SEK38367.1 orotidine-5'-phosphate decarboxylase [Alkalibacterium pelagium]